MGQQRGPGSMLSPIKPQHMQMQPDVVGTQMSFSAKHNGLYLYVGRILRELWCTSCCRKVVEDNKPYVSVYYYFF